MITSETVFRASIGPVSSDLDGETVILDTNSGQYFGLDDVGSKVWELLQENISFQSINSSLLAAYEVDPDRLEQDIISLLDEMIDNGLVQVVEAHS